ncbi:uncharacterized mitochondrial protein AtMg00810-like [Rutidosis leptorrhynchoides]|uniref:uncharacterized mitochondrial protein AtMg00810-like n=1 Tax=Rutidosis leptorrhynchoides TaxID=125765 RepID=UPI003A98EE07
MSLFSCEFAMKDLGPQYSFLGNSVKCNTHGHFLSQTAYAQTIIDCAGMSSCNFVSTPVDTSGNLSAGTGKPYSNPTEFCSLVGALQYLTFTRLDIAYVVQQICLHMHAPLNTHMNALKRIIRYIQGTF